VQKSLEARLRERGGSRSFGENSLSGGLGAGGRSGALATAAASRRESTVPANDPYGGDLAPLADVDMGGGTMSTTTSAWGMEKEPVAPVQNPTRVRIDHRQRSLESVFRASSTQSLPIEANADVVVAQEEREAFEEAQQLTTICELKADAVLRAEEKLSKTMNQSVYVGPISRELVLLQCGATLCLVNLARVARECAYQRLLRSFGNVAKISLKEGLPVKALLKLGIQDPLSGFDAVAHAHVDVDSLVTRLASLLDEKAEMFQEYLSLDISAGVLTSLPNALGVTSEVGLIMEGLPLFLLRLCTETNWADEKACFSSLCRCCADFCVETLLPTEEDAARVESATSARRFDAEATELNEAVEAGEFEDVAAAAVAASRKRARTVGPNALEELRWLHEALRRDGTCRVPGEFARDGTVLELVSLDQLYRIFERC